MYKTQDGFTKCHRFQLSHKMVIGDYLSIGFMNMDHMGAGGIVGHSVVVSLQVKEKPVKVVIVCEWIKDNVMQKINIYALKT